VTTRQQKRTFAIDVLRCAHWGGRRELLAVVMMPGAVVAIFPYLGLDTDGSEPRHLPRQLEHIHLPKNGSQDLEGGHFR
jgi:hypothetical protein